MDEAFPVWGEVLRWQTFLVPGRTHGDFCGEVEEAHCVPDGDEESVAEEDFGRHEEERD